MSAKIKSGGVNAWEADALFDFMVATINSAGGELLDGQVNALARLVVNPTLFARLAVAIGSHEATIAGLLWDHRDSMTDQVRAQLEERALLVAYDRASQKLQRLCGSRLDATVKRLWNEARRPPVGLAWADGMVSTPPGGERA